MRKTISGFTIVELLIVIVVIAILAAISVVAYSGIQQRARDSERIAEMKIVENALEMFYADNGGYPNCSGGVYIPTVGVNGPTCTVTSLANVLVPKYISAVPTDPINTGNDIYRYAVGYKKTGSNTFVSNQSNNFITGMRLESQVGNTHSGWTGTQYYNYLGGSSN